MRALAFALVALVATAACDEIRDADEVRVTITDEILIDGRTVVGDLFEQFPQLVQATRFDLTQSASFQTSGYDPGDIDDVELERLRFRVVDPPGQDLSFIGTAVFYLEADGLPRIEVARRQGFPPGATTVDFQTTNANLKAYLINNRGTVIGEITDSQLPPQPTRVEVTIVFEVDVDVL